MNYKKIISLGMAAVLMSASALAIASNNITAEPTSGVSVTQATLIVSQAQKIDISHIAPNVDVKYIVMKDNLMKVGNVGGGATLDIVSQTCSIDMPVGESFTSATLGAYENKGMLSGVTQASSLEEEHLRTEFAVLHEAAHCNLYSIANPFINQDKAVENNLNKYFKFSQSTIEGESNYSSIYYVLHENYADGLATMEIIRKYGDSPETISMLTKLAAERQGVAVTLSKGGFDSHSSGGVFEKILTPEMISKIMLAPNNKELQKMALEIANESTYNVIATYGDVHKIAGEENIYSGAVSLTSRLLFAKVSKDNTHQNVNIDKEGNYLFTIASNTLKELEDTYGEEFSRMKTNEDVSNWIQKNYKILYNTAFENTRMHIAEQLEAGNNITGDIAKNIEGHNVGVKMTIKEIRDSTRSKLASLNSGEGDKISVLARVHDIRDSSEIRVSSVPTKKP